MKKANPCTPEIGNLEFSYLDPANPSTALGEISGNFPMGAESVMRCLKHSDKTAMGRTEKGFDFLGYHFSPEGLSVAEKTIEKFLARAVRLYEQGPGEPISSLRLGLYVERWLRWVSAGLRCVNGHNSFRLGV
jgi:hypothetical protein